MPGLSLACSFNGRGIARKQLLASLTGLAHQPRYETHVLFDERDLFLAWTGYPEYPVRALRCGEFDVVLEGMLYGKTSDEGETALELGAVGRWCLSPDGNSMAKLEKWLSSTDGEFVITGFHRPSNRLFLVNDVLGRLPLYVHANHHSLLVSREIRFVSGLLDNLVIDRNAVAESLLLGCPLGSRTLIEKTWRLPASSLLIADLKEARWEVKSTGYLSLDEERRNLSVKTNAQDLAEIFLSACRRRAHPGSTTVVSLSGGLDSRAVAAGLWKNQIVCRAFTFSRSHGNDPDSRIARDIAKSLEIPWTCISVDHPTGRDLLFLLRIKGGLNHLGMAFILPFFEQIRESCGYDITYLTGDGGDKALRNLRPGKTLTTIDDLVESIISHHQVLSLRAAAELTHTTEADLKENLRQRVSTYPDESLEEKYTRFFFLERGFKRLFEGEDRNRFFFWSTTPFYSLDFFRTSMTCPHEQKKMYDLYREFLVRISEKVARIDYTKTNAAITSREHRLRLRAFAVYNKLPRELRERMRSWRKKPARERYLSCIDTQRRRCAVLGEYLSIDWLYRNADRLSQTEMERLLTLTSAIEELTTGSSSLTSMEGETF